MAASSYGGLLLNIANNKKNDMIQTRISYMCEGGGRKMISRKSRNILKQLEIAYFSQNFNK